MQMLYIVLRSPLPPLIRGVAVAGRIILWDERLPSAQILKMPTDCPLAATLGRRNGRIRDKNVPSGNLTNLLKSSSAGVGYNKTTWPAACHWWVTTRPRSPIRFHSTMKLKLAMNLKTLFATTLLASSLFATVARAENADHLAQLQQTNQCPGCDLRNVDLSGMNLERAVLSGANLKAANLSGAMLKDADLSGADLDSAQLQNTNLAGADLRDAILKYADLTGANLSWTKLQRANINFTNLQDANLKGAKWRGAIKRWVKQCNTTLPNGRVSNLDCNR